jgi:hypothetical protein
MSFITFLRNALIFYYLSLIIPIINIQNIHNFAFKKRNFNYLTLAPAFDLTQISNHHYNF